MSVAKDSKVEPVLEETGPETVLIVDDEPINLRLLRAHLQKHGYEVVEAKNGQEALEKAEESPDIILLDIMMPGMDGFQTCTHLKSNDYTKNIPVIFLSALTDSTVKARGLEAGGVDYIGKPFDSRELLARVRTHLTLKRQERQIRRYADNLEEMVKERTGKLVEAEKELKRDFDIQTVINALLRFSLDDISLDELLQHTLEEILSVTWLSFQTRGCVLLLDEEKNILRMAAHHNIEDKVLEVCTDIAMGSCACGRAAKEKKPMIVNDDDPEHDVRVKGDVPHSNYCMPIMHGETLLGVINIYLKKGYVPDKKEESFLLTVANTLARIILYKRAEEQILHHAFHDTLTGLPNRSYLLDRVGEIIETNLQGGEQQFAVMLMDLDRFNIINESLGHNIGDELLLSVGRRLQEILGEDNLLARLGGDEFAVLCSGYSDRKEVEALARRILSDIKQPFSLNGNELFTSFSIGIAMSSLGYEKAEDVLRDSDTALHRAKLLGKSRYEIFDREMHKKARFLMELVTDMRLAIERSEFLLHYQPIVSFKSGKVTGFEALVRWMHPKRGLVSPAEFIPMAEETELIIPIGNWVLREALMKMQAFFKEMELPSCMMISVNLSGKQFAREDVFEQTKMMLEETGFEPECLKLEITESVVMENAKTAVEMLQKLKSLNIKISIDDFGTGYSSLSYLHRFPVDMLKIDRSFVGRINEGGENLEIVRTIIDLAHNMGLEVIAEGVENEEQMILLRRLGCEYGQGYFFSKPMDLAMLVDMGTVDKVW